MSISPAALIICGRCPVSLRYSWVNDHSRGFAMNGVDGVRRSGEYVDNEGAQS